MVGPMDAIKLAKDIAELIKKYNDLPLLGKMVDLQGSIVEQSNELLRLNSENQDITRRLALKAKIRFVDPFYYEDGDNVPLCPTCYSSSDERLRIHLTHTKGGRKCRNCKQNYWDENRQAPSVEPQATRSSNITGYLS